MNCIKLFIEDKSDINKSFFIDLSDIREFFDARAEYVVIFKDGKIERFNHAVYDFTIFNRPFPF